MTPRFHTARKGADFGALLRLSHLVWLASAACTAVGTTFAGPTIGVLSKGPGVVWEQTEAGYHEAGVAANATLHVKVPPATTAVTAQLKFLDVLAAQKLDALVVAPTDPNRLAAPVKALAATGIKVVSLDTPLPDGIAQVHVCHDQRAMAEAVAKIVAELAGEGDQVAILRWLRSDRAVTEREEHLLSKLKELRPELKVSADVFATTGDNGTQSNARTLLQKHGRAKVVVSTSYGGTRDMLKLIQDRKLVGKLRLVGFGVDLPKEIPPALENGEIDVWIAQKPKELGLLSVQAAVALAKGEPVAPVLHTRFAVVTKQNLKSPEVQALKSGFGEPN